VKSYTGQYLIDVVSPSTAFGTWVNIARRFFQHLTISVATRHSSHTNSVDTAESTEMRTSASKPKK
jgi:hypothetical protein